MTENYLSGKKRSLKLGVSGHSENSTSLQTVGGVGIGTTNADKRALYVVGNTEITGVLTATSYSGDGSGLTGVAATDHVATFDLVVAGISTFHDDVRVTAGGIDVTSGIISATQFDVGTGGIDVDGQTDLDEVVVAGVSTFSALVDANARLDVVGGANIDQLNVAGVSTFSGISTFTNGSVFIADELFVGGVQVTGGGPIVGNDVLARHIKATGISTFQATLDVDGLIDADGGADIVGGVNITGGLTADSLTISGVTTGINVTGVSTFAQLVVSTGGLDVDGQTNLDEVVVAGVSTFAGNIVADTATFSGDVTVQGTLTSEDKTNIDSIGLVTARTGVRVTSGGLIVTAGVSTFSSAVDINAGLDVDGQADLDELVVAGVATFSNTVDVNASVDALNITAIGGNYTGVVTASSFSGDGSNLSGVGTAHLSSFDLVVAGISTFNDDVRILAGGLDVVSGVVSATQFDVGTGGIDVDGQTDLDELVVAGVSTFSALVDANVGANIVGGLTVDDINATGVTTIAEPSNTNTNSAWSVVNSGSSAYLFTGPGQDGSDNNSDLYLVRGQRYIFVMNTGGGHPLQIRVASGGAAYNTGVTNNGASSGNIIFNVQHDAPAQLYYQCTSHSGMVGNIYIIGGPQVISGVITATAFSGDGSGLFNLEPAGLSTTSTAFFKDIVASGGVKVTGITTSGSFEGDGSSLTGIGTQGPNVQAFGIDVAGISTFHDDVRILGGGLDVVGVSTFKDNVHLLDSDKLLLGGSAGTHDGLEIYHDSNHSYVNDTGSGGLYIGGSQIYLSNSAFNKTGIVINPDTFTALYYNGSQKFATTAVGATVYGNSKATTLHIAGISTLTGDVNFAGNLKNVNATGISSFIQLDVSTGGIDVDGQANLDEVVVAGVSTFSANVSIGSSLLFGDNKKAIFGDNAGGYLEVYNSGSDSFIKSHTDDLWIYGHDNIILAGTTSDHKYLRTVDGGGVFLYHNNSTKFETTSSGITVTGGITATGLDISTGGVDIDGQTDLDELVVAGVSTFSAKAVFNTAYPSIDADNEIQVGTAIQLGKAGVITATSFSGDGSGLTGIAATDHVSTFDLVVAGIATFYNDVKIVGGGSTAGNQITIGATTLNDGTLTFDGTAGQLFSISNNLTDGSIFSVNDVSGMPSIDVGAAGTIQLAPFGAGELVGIGTTRPTSKLDVVGDVQVVGVVTATSFSGSGANLTNLPASTDGSFIGLNVTGVATFSNTANFGAVNITGSSTFTGSVLDFADSKQLRFGTGNDFEVFFNGTDQYLKSKAGKIRIEVVDGDAAITCNPNGSVEIFHDANKKLETTSTGAIVTGVLTATTFSGSGASLDTLNASELDSGTIPSGRYGTGNLLVKARSTSAASDSGSNVFAGPNAGAAFNGSSGDHNTFFGISAGQNNDGGQNNTFLGSNAGNTNVSGHENVAIGQAAFENGTGDQNICIGRAAGNVGSFSGDNNIIIGHDADPTAAGTSNEITFGDSNINKFRIPGLSFTLEPGGANITGVLTATSFSGDGSSLTGVGTQGPNVQAFGIVVAGISTFHHEVQVGGGLTVVGVTTFNNDAYWRGQGGSDYDMQWTRSNGQLRIKDSGKLVFGSSGDVSVYHNDTDFYLYNTKGNSYIQNTGDVYLRTNGTENAVIAKANAEVELYYNAIQQMETTAQGIDVTGRVETDLLNVSGVSTFSGYPSIDADNEIQVGTAIQLGKAGVITATSFSGDGSALTGIEAGGTGDFYVGFTSSVTMNANSFEVTGHTFPSTASKTYVIDSIMASNVAEVGIGTTVNLIASISSNSGVAAGTTEQTYFAYNIPIAAGGAIELIKEPFVANPNDIVKLWATDSTYVGIASAIQVHMTYTQQDSTDFFGKYAANTSIGSTTIIGIHTAGTTKSATIQSVHITNRSDAGAFPVDIMMTDSTGIVTTYLVKNLVIPKYSAVEILERPKRMETGSSLGVKVQQTGTIDVIVSGKTYS